MSRDAVNYVLNASGISTGSLKIFYDFSGYQGSYPNSYVPSVESGNNLYSGKLFSTNAAAETLLTGQNGIANFSGGCGGIQQYIKIGNESDLYNSESTFIFSAEQATQFDVGNSVQEPINNKNVIFSNVTGEGNCISGWELGLNSANNLYFKTFDENQPFVLSHDGTPYGRNAWFMRSLGKTVDIGRLDPFDFSIEKTSASLSETVTNGGDWYLGTGLYSNTSPIDVANLGGTFAGKIHNFLYFNSYLNNAQVRDVSIALCNDLNSQITLSGALQSDISGNSISYSGISGVLHSTGVLSGYVLSATGSVTVERATELSGYIPPYEAYFYRKEQISGLSTAYLGLPEYIYETRIHLGPPFNGITGLEYSEITINLSGLVPVYYQSGVSGIVSSGFEVSGTTTGAVVSGSTTSNDVGVVGIESLYPRSFSYLGIGASGDFIDVISRTESSLTGSSNLNKEAIISYSNHKMGETLYLDDLYSGESLNLFLNGVGYRRGGIVINETEDFSVVTQVSTGTRLVITCDGIEQYSITTTGTDIFSEGRVVETTLLKDYGLSGAEIIFPQAFTGTETQNLFGVYDVNQPSGGANRQELTITGTNQYTGAPFYSLNPSGKQVFFNGQKIYPSQGYLDGITGLHPTGYITGFAGLYFTIPNYSGSWQKTGVNNLDRRDEYNMYSGELFKPFSKVVYINGLRKSLLDFIQHDIQRDLISGTTGFISDLTGIAEGNWVI